MILFKGLFLSFQLYLLDYIFRFILIAMAFP